MRKIASTIVCYVIAMILLFFGTSIDEADALFYTQKANAESVVTFVFAGEATISEVKSLDTKIVSTRNESAVQHLTNSSVSGKKDVRNYVYILPVADLLDNGSCTEKAVYINESPDLCHQIAVLNYIHDLDGKKRVL